MQQKFLEQNFLGNSIFDYLICIGVLFAGFVVVQLFKRFALWRLKKLAEKTTTTLDDFFVRFVRKIILPAAYFGAFYLSLNTLSLDPLLKRIIDITGMSVLTIFTARFATMLIAYGLDVYLTKRGKDSVLERSLQGILRISNLVIWGLAIVFFLDNLGFKISAVIAGLGVGGVAVALAAQAILGDLFSYFAIIFDRPFEIGDFIITGDFLGTIEYVGIKTTRVRSLGGEQLIFSNKDLTNSRLRNYKRMERRRVVFKLGVTYQTPYNKLEIMPELIKGIIENIQDTVFDRAHFASYGDFNLVFEVVYYVMGKDYNKYMDIQQEINLAIKKEFEAQNIDFAYPTQTLHMAKT